jgi:hypothetical protein
MPMPSIINSHYRIFHAPLRLRHYGHCYADITPLAIAEPLMPRHCRDYAAPDYAIEYLILLTLIAID